MVASGSVPVKGDVIWPEMAGDGEVGVRSMGFAGDEAAGMRAEEAEGGEDAELDGSEESVIAQLVVMGDEEWDQASAGVEGGVRVEPRAGEVGEGCIGGYVRIELSVLDAGQG